MDEDFLERIDILPSADIEKLIFDQGTQLYNALAKAERYDEIALLAELISTYTYTTSYYGDKTGRIPEDFAVDLNEAALLKLNGSGEWQRFADSFKKNFDSFKNS